MEPRLHGQTTSWKEYTMIDIKNRRECFFDNFLINEEETTAERRMHKPQRREVIFELNMPWEGEHASMFTVFYAEGKWHMYYCIQKKPKSICYATSNDALHWDRPSLGRVEFNGSTDNNLLFSEEDLKQFEFVGFDNMSVFYDENPACPPSEKYKMVAWWTGHAALVLLTSPDPINFGNHRMITDDGEFDSQNRAFYSPEHG